jgi:hypothetical protein
VSPSALVRHSTYDASRKITQDFLAANFAGTLVQPLTGGSFEIRGSNTGGIDGNKLLLSGKVFSGSILGSDNGTVGAVVESNITYTGGLIYNALVSSNLLTTGAFSRSLTDINLPLSIAGNSYLDTFTANSTGSFTTNSQTIPEPASLSMTLAGLACLLPVLRRARVARVSPRSTRSPDSQLP